MQKVNLNLIPGSVLPVVNVSQYDVGRQFQLAVYDGAAAYSLTGKDVQIRGTKPDGNGFAYDSTDGAISVSNNVVTVSTLQQMTACGGQVMCELRITSGSDILGTINFIMDCEPSALSDDTPLSDTDIPAIERDFQAALDEAEADALVAEGWAKETQDGVPVTSGSPYYHKSAYYNKQIAEASATTAGTNALKSEGYAVGTQNGTAVTSGSPYYENNAKYYAERAAASVAQGTQVDFYVSGGHLYVQQTIQGVVQPAVDLGPIGSASAIADLTDVDLTSLADGDYLRYNSTAQKWEVSHAVTDNLAAVENVLGAKNLYDPSSLRNGMTVYGLTFTVSDKGIMSISGTYDSTTGAARPLTTDWNIPISLPDEVFGQYITAYDKTATLVYTIALSDDNGHSITLNSNSKNGVLLSFKPTKHSVYTTGFTNNTAYDLTIYPMIRDARITDDTYVPYAMTNRELTEKVQGIISAATNAADFAAFKAAIAAL